MHSLNIKLNEMEAGIREIAIITKSFPSSLSLQCRTIPGKEARKDCR